MATSIGSSRILWRLLAAIGATGLVAMQLAGAAWAAGPRLPGSVTTSTCDASQFPASTNPANPLDLATAPPAGDPLTGAQFFVDGPAHGMAAGALAQLVGLDPTTLPSTLSWSTFWGELQSNPRLTGDPSLKTEADAFALIASQPEAQRLSLYSGGGGPEPSMARRRRSSAATWPPTREPSRFSRRSSSTRTGSTAPPTASSRPIPARSSAR